jgi:cobalamin biosynthesis protein CbiG
MTMIPPNAPLVVGLGCSSSASAGEIVALVTASLLAIHADPAQIRAFATHVRKRDSLALIEAASHFDVPLRFLADDELASDYPGTCEAVAAAAGVLVSRKRKSHFATCAVAVADPGFDPAAFGQPASPSAATASSTLSTSLAGP